MEERLRWLMARVATKAKSGCRAGASRGPGRSKINQREDVDDGRIRRDGNQGSECCLRRVAGPGFLCEWIVGFNHSMHLSQGHIPTQLERPSDCAAHSAGDRHDVPGPHLDLPFVPNA